MTEEVEANREVLEAAARLGILTQYRDGLGRLRTADPEALARIVEALSQASPPPLTPPHRAKSVGGGEPARCWQGEARREWALAVQLYGLRSCRNWGHGDFTDLLALIDLAADLGAAGIGLNPLHALFDERAEPSPYAPNSRVFLNP